MPDRRHITDLRIALEGERRATTQVRAARHHVDELIAQAVAAGVPYDRIARIALKLRLGRAPNAQERQREADRFRQRRRRAVTRGHGKGAEPRLKPARPAVGSLAEVNDMSERLIRRKTETVEEEFEVHDEDKELDEDDDEDETED